MLMVRTFIAFEVPPNARSALVALQEQFRSVDTDIRWTPKRNLHSTIRFLGDVEESSLQRLNAILDEVAAGVRQFPVIFREAGVYPGRRNPRVLWVGCSEVDGSLAAFKSRLDRALTVIGFEEEARPYSPHVTLGRISSKKKIGHLLSLLENLTFEPTTASINGIVVLKSVLSPLGADYSLLHSIRIPQS
jgi:2'-5' RNA ligase